MADTRPEPNDSAASTAVLNTYELLERIILSLAAKTIVNAASRVDKTWHSVITSSTRIDKRIISSRLFIEALQHRRVKNANITRCPFFWGTVIIKRLKDMELICAVDRSTSPSSFAPRLLTDIRGIPGLTIADQNRFTQGWWKALTAWRSTTGGREFLTRFEFALYKHLDPLYGSKAEQLYKVCKANGWSERHWPTRLPPAIARIWSLRECASDEWWNTTLQEAISEGDYI